MFENINWLALVAASVASLAVGFVWYGSLFGQAWSRATGLTEADMKASYNPALFFGGTLAMAFVAAIFIHYWVSGHEMTGLEAFKHGAFHGGQIALMTVAPVMATNAIYERKSLAYVGINVGYWVLCFALMGGILLAWK